MEQRRFRSLVSAVFHTETESDAHAMRQARTVLPALRHCAFRPGQEQAAEYVSRLRRRAIIFGRWSVPLPGIRIRITEEMLKPSE